MSIDQIINLLALITLVEMMFAIGLGVTLADVADVAQDWRLLGRAALANYGFVPAAAVVLLFLFHANPAVAAGFLVIASALARPMARPSPRWPRGMWSWPWGSW